MRKVEKKEGKGGVAETQLGEKILKMEIKKLKEIELNRELGVRMQIEKEGKGVGEKQLWEGRGVFPPKKY